MNTPELGDKSLFKIGWSQDMNDRLKQLQTGNGFTLHLYKYILTTERKLETKIHTSLKQYRKQGEWFNITESDVDDIVKQYKISNEEELTEETDKEVGKELIEELIEETKTTKRTYRVTKEIHTCEKCDKTFTEKRYLTRHIQNKTCEKVFTCDKCGETFANKRNKDNHMRRKNPCDPMEVPVIDLNNLENKCEFCENTYSTQFSLKRHITTCSMKNNQDALFQLVLDRLDKLEKNTKNNR